MDSINDSARPNQIAGPLPNGLVEAANQSLRGLQTVSLQAADLLAALQMCGMPCMLDQLTRRFNDYLRRSMSGHDQSNTRLTISEELEDQTQVA